MPRRHNGQRAPRFSRGGGNVSLTVLLVDDNEDFLEQLADGLRRRGGFIVHTASTVSKARAIVELRSVHVAVVDFIIGRGVDGEKLAVLLRAQSRRRGLKVLLLSGFEYSGNAFDGLPLMKGIDNEHDVVAEAIRKVAT